MSGQTTGLRAAPAGLLSPPSIGARPRADILSSLANSTLEVLLAGAVLLGLALALVLRRADRRGQDPIAADVDEQPTKPSPSGSLKATPANQG